MPTRAWIATALQWIRTLALATLFLALGQVLDASLNDTDTSDPLLLGAIAGGLAVLCAGVAAAVPPRLRAVEEQHWRGSGIRAALRRNPATPSPSATASPSSAGHGGGHGAGHGAGHGGGSRPSSAGHGIGGGHPGAAGKPTGKPAGKPAGGGRPGGGEADLLAGGVERIAEYRAEFLGPAVAAFTAPALILLLIGVFLDPVIAGVLLVLVLMVPPLVRFFLARFRGPTAAYRRLAGQATAKFQDVLRSLGGLVLLGAEDAGRKSVAEAAAALRVQAVALLRRSQLMILVNDALFSLVMITAAVALALWRFDAGAISLGGALAVVLLATLLYEPIDKLGRSFYVAMAGRAQQAVFTQTLTTPGKSRTAPTQRPVADPLEAASQKMTQPGAEPLLRLDRLGVERDGTSVLRALTLEIPRGSTLAVVGPSGAGKSTLALVLQGLLATSSGQLLLEGRPASPQALQAAAVTVPQKPFIFSGTVAENLRLAQPEATDDQLWDVLAKARLDVEISAKKKGLATEVGENGGALSGGQIRRLAIARALLSGAKLLILDEPTADLDRRAEQLVDESLQALATDHTLVIIAHRLATTRWADQVLVLESGEQAALGTPDELLAGSGYYAQATAGEGEQR